MKKFTYFRAQNPSELSVHNKDSKCKYSVIEAGVYIYFTYTHTHIYIKTKTDSTTFFRLVQFYPLLHQ